MLTVLDNPALHNGHACGGASRASQSPLPGENLQSEVEDPAPSSIQQSENEALDPFPSHFDSQERLQFLYSFLNPDLDSLHVASRHGLKLSEYHAYVISEEFQHRLADQTRIAELRAAACAKMAQPKAVATLEHILDSYNEAERNELVDDGRTPRFKLRGLRQRHRESARRASWLLLRIAGALPGPVRSPSSRATGSPPSAAATPAIPHSAPATRHGSAGDAQCSASSPGGSPCAAAPPGEPAPDQTAPDQTAPDQYAPDQNAAPATRAFGTAHVESINEPTADRTSPPLAFSPSLSPRPRHDNPPRHCKSSAIPQRTDTS